MNAEKITQQIVIDALRQSGIQVIPVTDEQAMDFFMDVERRNRAEFQMNRPEIFCSTAAMVLQSLKQERASASQWLGMLTKAGGIKSGEDAWIELSDWLQSQGKSPLSKTQIMDYISSHQLQIEEVEFGLPESSSGLKKYQEELDEYIAEAETIYPESNHEYHRTWAFECMEDYYGEDFGMAFGHDDGKLYIFDSGYAAEFTGDMTIDGLRLQHTTKGLDDYKELAFYTANTPVWDDSNPDWEEDQRIHFGNVGDGRCFAWVRFGEKTVNGKPTAQEIQKMIKNWPGPEEWTRTNSSGVNVYHTGQWNFPHERAMITQTVKGYSLYNMITDRQSIHKTLKEAVNEYINQQVNRKITSKILVIDEIQSKRHEKGRKMGYIHQNIIYELDKLQRESSRRCDDYFNRLRELRDLAGVPYVDEELEKRFQAEDTELQRTYALWKESFNHLRDFNHQHEQELELYRKNKLVPAAPFEKNWHEVCMKRMLRYAAEHDYDKILWLTGEQQAERYKLGNKVTGISSEPYCAQSRNETDGFDVEVYTEKGKMFLFVDKNGIICSGEWNKKDYSGQPLDNLIGQKLSQRILSSDKPLEMNGQDTDFRIGHQSMVRFYDEMLPQFINRYTKKWGGRVEDTGLGIKGPEGQEMIMHGIDITPQMKEAALRSQPLFMANPKKQIYGWAVDNTIYLTPRGMNTETAIHEYTHLWAEVMRQKDPAGWEQIKNLLRDTPVWNEVRKDKNYRYIRRDEDRVTSEALARVSGRENSVRLEQAVRQAVNRDSSLHGLQQIKQALSKFWSWVGRHILHMSEAKSVSEVTDRILGDLLRGNIVTMKQSKPSDRIENIRVMLVGEMPFVRGTIRCKVDGEQQMSCDLTPRETTEWLTAKSDDSRDIVERKLAEKYYRNVLQQEGQEQNTGLKR